MPATPSPPTGTSVPPGLAGSVTLTEVVRVATTVTRGSVDVVAFVRERALVVASLARKVLQPRPLSPAEHAAREGRVHTGGGMCVPIRSQRGEVVGALSVAADSPVEDATADVLHSLARLAAAEFERLSHRDADHDQAAAMIEHLRDAILVLDPAFTITFANPTVAAMIGRTPAELVGTSGADLVHPDDLVTALEAFERISSGAEVYRVMLRVRHGSGNWERVEVTGRDLTNHPAIGGVLVTLRTGDWDLELADSLDRQRRFLAAMLDQLHDGVVAIDALGYPTVVNQAARRLHGAAADVPVTEIDVAGAGFLDGDGRPLHAGHTPLRRAHQGETVREASLSMLDGSGSLRSVEVTAQPIMGEDGHPLGAVAVYHDVTDARAAERELLSRALHDQLTGLPNRRLLSQRFAEFATVSATASVAVCFVDLDGFKLVNDSYGHRVGDMAVRVAAQRFLTQLRPGDVLARLGGDEFVAVLPGVSDPALAANVAQRLRAALAEPVEVAGHRLTLGTSIGVVVGSLAATDEDELLRRADVALYAAKAAGRDRVVFYDEELGRTADLQRHQFQLLKTAFDTDALLMHFQPVVAAGTGKVTGFEALVRCRLPDGTLVGPAAFLDAAISSGLVIELDRRAFAMTCQAAALLCRARPDEVFTMACNFSALTISQAGFADDVLATIARNGLDPATICVEITETAAFDMGPQAVAALTRLRVAGVSLALDDFGTGYSSLAHLRDLPLDTVKVDRSFISRLDRDSSERSITQAVVAMAGTLRLAIVAEGVESSAQLDEARNLGFTYVQGFLCSPARTLDEILDLLQAPNANWLA
jgi:diguanylate cyclase (GGDEF)-like protein/PAS domain S-box-containing protein